MGNYWPLLGYRSYPRWLRHRTLRGNVNLRLYEYWWPRSIRESQPTAVTRADKNGRFDFGVLREGHYTLVIDWPTEYANFFDVEVKRLPAETSSVTIDVSPVDPGCNGGHEFISYSK